MALGPFDLSVSWTGSTQDDDYTRHSTLSVHSKADVRAGDAHSEARWNPEELLGAALAQCHMLTFLALARKVKLDVRAYSGGATVELSTEDKITRVSRITLTPTIRLAHGADLDKAATMFDKAHKYCFIANSITAEIVMDARFEHV